MVKDTISTTSNQRLLNTKRLVNFIESIIIRTPKVKMYILKMKGNWFQIHTYIVIGTKQRNHGVKLKGKKDSLPLIVPLVYLLSITINNIRCSPVTMIKVFEAVNHFKIEFDRVITLFLCVLCTET